jgi:hypothetical protein
MLATIQPRTILSSHLLSKNVRFRVHKTTTLHAVLYGCEIWSLTLRVEQRLRVCDSGVMENVCTEER